MVDPTKKEMRGVEIMAIERPALCIYKGGELQAIVLRNGKIEWFKCAPITYTNYLEMFEANSFQNYEKEKKAE